MLRTKRPTAIQLLPYPIQTKKGRHCLDNVFPKSLLVRKRPLRQPLSASHRELSTFLGIPYFVIHFLSCLYYNGLTPKYFPNKAIKETNNNEAYSKH